jgi:hypothetical protein
MFAEVIDDLEKLGRTKIAIEAEGTYPNGKSVAEVSEYQDHGTATITASNYTQRAEDENNGFKDLVFDAAIAELYGVSNSLQAAGNKVAEEIMKRIDRIDTGQLKVSLKALIE